MHRCQAILDSNIVVDSTAATAALAGLQLYKKYAVKMIDLVRRRLIEGEAIPAADKIYSIFEPHTEWIT